MELIATALAEKGYGVFPDLVPDKTQRELVQVMEIEESKDLFVSAGVGRGINKKVRSEIRNDSIIWLDENNGASICKTYVEGMNSLCEYLRRSLFLSVWAYEGHLARYPANGYYKPHLDRHSKTATRQISVILYLNKDWQESDGGQLRLYTDFFKGVDGPYIDILPISGTIVVFRSADFWHEVISSMRPRISLTGWLNGLG